MENHPVWTSRSRVLRNSVSIMIFSSLSLVLTACFQSTGDFGRAPNGVFEASVLPFTGSIVAKLRGEPASLYALTEDEKELRSRAWHFLMPEADAPVLAQKHDQLAFHRLLPAREADVTFFHRTIMGGPHFGTLIGDSPRARAVFGPGSFKSLTSRYNRVRDQISADHALIPYFKLTASQVTQADQIRARSLGHVADVTEEQRSEAIQRICENAALIARVNWAFHDRSAMYRYSLEHLLIEGPEREAIPAERTLMAFETDLSQFRRDATLPRNCTEPVDLPPIQAPRPLVRKG